MPASCGDGSEPRFGYGPLDRLAPDQIDDLATPAMAGSVGAMNETGSMEPVIQMKRVVLGEEDLTLAQRIYGNLTDAFKSDRPWQGTGAPLHAPYLPEVAEEPEPVMYEVAKALHTTYFAPRKQKKFSIGDVLDFLAERGMPVQPHDYRAAGIHKAMVMTPHGPGVRGPGGVKLLTPNKPKKKPKVTKATTAADVKKLSSCCATAQKMGGTKCPVCRQAVPPLANDLKKTK